MNAELSQTAWGIPNCTGGLPVNGSDIRFKTPVKAECGRRKERKRESREGKEMEMPAKGLRRLPEHHRGLLGSILISKKGVERDKEIGGRRGTDCEDLGRKTTGGLSRPSAIIIAKLKKNLNNNFTIQA